MKNKIKEVKEQLANELNYKSWEDCINDQPNYKVEALMDTVAIRLCEVSRSLPTSTQLLSDCKNRFKDLRANNYKFDYRSYQNGYLDSFSKYAVKPSDNG